MKLHNYYKLTSSRPQVPNLQRTVVATGDDQGRIAHETCSQHFATVTG